MPKSSKPSKTPIPLITTSHLSKSFDLTPALTDVSLTLNPGKIYGLLGKNGAGKSTLIKLLTGLLIPTSGEIKFKNKPLSPTSKSKISYLPERTYLDTSTTASDNLHLFQTFYPDFSRSTAEKLLATFNLPLDKKLSTFSKGMQEKLQLSLVLSRSADLYILDEPLGGIDPATRDQILDIILSSLRPTSSLLISTHLISDIERILDELIFLDRGRLTLTTSADSLREQTKGSIDAYFRKNFKF